MPLMPLTWNIEEVARPFFDGLPTKSITAFADALGIDLRPHRDRTLVQPLERIAADGSGSWACFVKVYASRRHPWQGFLRRSRAVVEARNLGWIRSWGIPCPRVLAWGAERGCGGLCSRLSLLVTESAPRAVDLLDFWKNKREPADPSLRRQLLRTMALQTRRLHDHHFFHQDLKWRNLLVSEAGQQPEIWWIDCPNGYRCRLPARARHGAVKDLATLDKVAKDRCSEEERFAFLQAYLGEERVNARVERWADRVVRYRKRRQDD